MAGEHKGWLLTGALEQGVQVTRDRIARARVWAGFAPAGPRAVVPAGARKARELGLNVRPGIARLTRAGFDDHCRAALARAEEVHRAPAHIVRFPDRRERELVLATGLAFVDRA